MRLWHDDVRPPPDDSWDFWARNNSAAIEFLKTGAVTECSLDHDLGDWEAPFPDDPEEAFDQLVRQHQESTETGLDLVHWMIATDNVPTKVTIHSWNPVGARNMAARLNRFGYDCYLRPFQT